MNNKKDEALLLLFVMSDLFKRYLRIDDDTTTADKQFKEGQLSGLRNAMEVVSEHLDPIIKPCVILRDPVDNSESQA